LFFSQPFKEFLLMTLSMYQASIPVFIRISDNLSAILKKAEEDAAARKIDPSVFMNARLAPDMLALPRQIQIASDGVKGFAARVGGVEVPSYADTENSFAELQGRIAKTVAFLKTFKADQIDGTEDKDISLKLGGEERKFKAQPYLLNFVLPNFYFHVTTAYAILRHNGVSIGKMDYLGNLQT
jgi:hypothetical protein